MTYGRVVKPGYWHKIHVTRKWPFVVRKYMCNGGVTSYDTAYILASYFHGGEQYVLLSEMAICLLFPVLSSVLQSFPVFVAAR